MAHSLNLVGKCAADSCPAAVSFFGLVEKVYAFFAASTHRWGRLRDALNKEGLKVDKRLSATRWSARVDAVPGLRAAVTLRLPGGGVEPTPPLRFSGFSPKIRRFRIRPFLLMNNYSSPSLCKKTDQNRVSGVREIGAPKR